MQPGATRFFSSQSRILNGTVQEILAGTVHEILAGTGQEILAGTVKEKIYESGIKINTVSCKPE
jgi:hypothetical protein